MQLQSWRNRLRERRSSITHRIWLLRTSLPANASVGCNRVYSHDPHSATINHNRFIIHREGMTICIHRTFSRLQGWMATLASAMMPRDSLVAAFRLRIRAVLAAVMKIVVLGAMDASWRPARVVLLIRHALSRLATCRNCKSCRRSSFRAFSCSNGSTRSRTNRSPNLSFYSISVSAKSSDYVFVVKR